MTPPVHVNQGPAPIHSAPASQLHPGTYMHPYRHPDTGRYFAHFARMADGSTSVDICRRDPDGWQSVMLAWPRERPPFDPAGLAPMQGDQPLQMQVARDLADRLNTGDLTVDQLHEHFGELRDGVWIACADACDIAHGDPADDDDVGEVVLRFAAQGRVDLLDEATVSALAAGLALAEARTRLGSAALLRGVLSRRVGA